MNWNGNRMTLSEKDTKRWQDNGPDGVGFRALVRDVALVAANKAGHAVEVYAAESDGGWMAVEVMPCSMSPELIARLVK